MSYSAIGVKTKLFETKSINVLEQQINDFLVAHCDAQIITIQYHSDKEEYEKQFTAMIVYAELD